MSRLETLLNALLNGKSADIKPQSRKEAYLSALLRGDSDVEEPKSRSEAYLYALCKKGLSGGGSAGGSAEIPTCTVRFVSGDNVYSDGYYAYTKYENGNFVTVCVANQGQSDEFDVVMENVVCGSLIKFSWSYYDGDVGVSIDGTAEQIEDSFGATNESSMFIAPIVAGETCTINVIGWGNEDWGDDW